MKAKTMNALAMCFHSRMVAWFVKAGIAASVLLLPLLTPPWFELDHGSMAYAERPPGTGGGKPDIPPGGGGKGKPDDPPGGGGGKPDKPGRGSGDLYSDLVFVYRTEEGLPIYIGVPAGVEDVEEVDVRATMTRLQGDFAAADLPGGYVACEQPIAEAGVPDQAGMIAAYILSTAPNLSNPLFNPADGRDVTPVPLGGTGVAGEECDVLYDPDLAYDFREYTDEVSFGRMNVGRSPERVLRQQLTEVANLLKGPDVVIGWDHAGRISVNGVAIDSPLQSLAIHETLMEHGQIIGAPALPNLPWNDLAPPLPDPPMDDLDWLDYAAAAIGGAADKGDYRVAGGINLDLIVYNNRILHIPNETLWADTLEGDGTEGALNELYIDYSGYTYKRSDKYPGCFEGFGLGPDQGFLMDAVFAGQEFEASNIFGFATAADDSRRVISFGHDYLDGARFDQAGSDALCYELGLLE